jgi:ribonucleoside-diphosphate reductase alpha chain
VAKQLLAALARTPFDATDIESLTSQLKAQPAAPVTVPAGAVESAARIALQAASDAMLVQQDPTAPPRAVRHRLAEERASLTHKFSIAGHEGYITVGLYPNGQPGEIFIRMAKEGSTVSGLMDAFATAISLSLQHGVPLRVLCEKFAHTRFEPSGWTGNEQIGFAKSIMDYIFRWLQIRFLSGQQLPLFAGLAGAGAAPESPAALQPPAARSALSAPAATESVIAEMHAASAATPQAASGDLHLEDRGLYHAADAMRALVDMGDAPSCHTCGAIMVRNGSCYKCVECGSTSGCS